MDRSRDCELCQARAAVYCCADEAYVCWECDSKVHGANFIVARHLRPVLCRRCQSPTAVLAESSTASSFFSPLCPTCACTGFLGEESKDEHSSTTNRDLGDQEEVSSQAARKSRSRSSRSRSPSPVSVIPATRKRKITAAISKHQQETVERLEHVLRNWEGELGLKRSDHRLALAMQLLRRTAGSIKANRLERIDARAALAVCLWISVKMESSRSRSPPSLPRLDRFERCTGIPADVLLTMEAKLCDKFAGPL